MVIVIVMAMVMAELWRAAHRPQLVQEQIANSNSNSNMNGNSHSNGNGNGRPLAGCS